MLIGIAGPSASGKTTFTKKLYEIFKSSGIECVTLSMDDYFYDRSYLTPEEMKNHNFDHPSAIEFSLLEKHLNMLLEKKSVPKLVYHHRHARREYLTESINPAEMIIIEGLHTFYHQSILNKMDLKIFVETDLETCLQRRIKRSEENPDRVEPKEILIERYKNYVVPMYQKYIESQKCYADLVIRGD